MDDAERGMAFAGKATRVWKRLRADEQVYGLGEKTGDLNKRGRYRGGYAYAMWNSDTYAYETDTDPIYVSVPFYIVLRKGRAHGIFLEAALSRAFAWPTLAAEAGSLAEARAIVERALDPVSLATHAPPIRPDLAILVGASQDGFVPKRDVEALHRHWPGSELRWVTAGHVTSAALHHGAHAERRCKP